jgi:hypothetical protein
MSSSHVIFIPDHFDEHTSEHMNEYAHAQTRVPGQGHAHNVIHDPAGRTLAGGGGLRYRKAGSQTAGVLPAGALGRGALGRGALGRGASWAQATAPPACSNPRRIPCRF